MEESKLNLQLTEKANVSYVYDSVISHSLFTSNSSFCFKEDDKIAIIDADILIYDLPSFFRCFLEYVFSRKISLNLSEILCNYSFESILLLIIESNKIKDQPESEKRKFLKKFQCEIEVKNIHYNSSSLQSKSVPMKRQNQNLSCFTKETEKIVLSKTNQTENEKNEEIDGKEQDITSYLDVRQTIIESKQILKDGIVKIEDITVQNFSFYFEWLSIISNLILTCKPNAGVISFLKFLTNFNFKIIFVTKNILFLENLCHFHEEKYKALLSSCSSFKIFLADSTVFLSKDFFEKFKKNHVFVFPASDIFKSFFNKIQENSLFKHKVIFVKPDSAENSENKDFVFEKIQTLREVDLSVLNTSVQIPPYIDSYLPLANRVYPDKTCHFSYEYFFWDAFIFFKEPVCIKGLVVHGFARGKLMGLPTANLLPQMPLSPVLLSGIYVGLATLYVDALPYSYHTVLSVGYNPFFDNEVLTIEAHLFTNEDLCIYGETLLLTIKGFMRNQANFIKLSYLIETIQNDCDATRCLINLKNDERL